MISRAKTQLCIVRPTGKDLIRGRFYDDFLENAHVSNKYRKDNVAFFLTPHNEINLSEKEQFRIFQFEIVNRFLLVELLRKGSILLCPISWQKGLTKDKVIWVTRKLVSHLFSKYTI